MVCSIFFTHVCIHFGLYIIQIIMLRGLVSQMLLSVPVFRLSSPTESSLVFGLDWPEVIAFYPVRLVIVRHQLNGIIVRVHIVGFEVGIHLFHGLRQGLAALTAFNHIKAGIRHPCTQNCAFHGSQKFQSASMCSNL